MKSNPIIEASLPGTVRKFKSNSPLIYQGEAPRSGFYIKNGVVKAYTLQSNGQEQVVGFYGPGSFFPLPWLFGQTTNSMYYYETISVCNTVAVTRSDIDVYVKSNQQVTKILLEQLVKEQSANMVRITALEQSRAMEKIVFTLYYLLFQFGKKLEDNVYQITIPLTHSTIANLVGLTRETTATELNKLKRKNVVSYSKKLYTINQKKLESTIGEDSFAELIQK